ncbi:hypothetical protein TRFO_01320 [Tritrichomonas foetus]|uniref:Uncharacterized protein n=1 Tax=Tritrichomonas foetus TaxID=1144522 RepID=A0A1J4K8H4_9EUKA|nr:hypothetical protein TRFO_01320 [Tritrichomonas foetus]|eukprot:OHT07184.1 hypothetical protein TRFO_01320 [Tritrichomonas foetus]
MEKKKLNSTYSDFDIHSHEADSLLENSTDFSEIVNSGLRMIHGLTNDVDIDAYTEIHTRCTSYLFDLRKKLSDRTVFTKDILQEGFELALSCPFVLPRLYMCLLIACTTQDLKQLKLVSDMMPSVAHPLRGILLRYTAISFFPKQSELLITFIIKNFQEMLYLLPGLLKLFPYSKQNACGWLTSNTTVSLYLCDNNPQVVKSFFKMAQTCDYSFVAVSIIESISQSIEGPQISKFFDCFAEFFYSKNGDATNIEIALACCQKCNNPREAYNFILKTPFHEECGIHITSLAIGHKDIEIVKLCARRWLNYDVQHEILINVDLDTYANLIKALPHGFETTKEFIRMVNENTKPESVRKILSNELTRRSRDLDLAITEMLTTHNFSKEFYEIVFAKPYKFVNFKQITSIVSKSESLGIEKDTIIGFLENSSTENVNINSLRCHYYKTGDNADRLVTLLKGKSNLTKRILMSHLARLEVSDESLSQLLDKCNEENELASFCLLAAQKKNIDLAEKAILKIVDLDKEIKKVSETIALYFRTINMIATITDACEIHESKVNEGENESEGKKLVFPVETTKRLLEHIAEIIEKMTFKLFPLMSRDKSNFFQKICRGVMKKKYFATFEDLILRIIDLLQKC